MHHHQAAGGDRLDGEVAVADRIEGVLGHRREAELLGDVMAVERIHGAGQCGAAQGQHVGALAGIEQARLVAQHLFAPGQHVVAEGHRLGDLEMGEAGHDAVGFALGEIEQAGGEAVDQADQFVDGVAHVQAHVGGDLIVAAAAGVQALAGVADALGEPRLDVHVHVFQRLTPLEAAGGDVGGDVVQSADDGLDVVGREHPDLAEHAGVGLGAGDVLFPEALIEGHRLREALDQGRGGLGEATAPHRVLGRGSGGGLAGVLAHGVCCGVR
jgi:hypothetical protein